MGYYPVKEFKVDIYELDVVLFRSKEDYDGYIKKVRRGPVPRHLFPIAVFEVQFHGNLDVALSRLKHAYDLWGCKLFLIISRNRDLERTYQLLGEMLSGAFHEIRNKIEVLVAEDIIKLANSLNEHKNILQKLIALPA